MNSQIFVFVGIAFFVCLMMYVQRGVDLKFSFDLFSRKLCSCSRCVNQIEEDPWFLERYDSLVPVMMNRRNSRLSNLTNYWWMKLQESKQKYVYNNVIESLFSIIPDVEYYTDADPARCRTCAVVGNSANLLSSHYGPLIDAHDFIIRMNQAPTKNFEKDVGNRTTHRAIYPESAVDADNSTHIVLLPFKILDLQWLISVFTTQNITRTYTTVIKSIKADKGMVMVLNPEFMRYVYEIWLKKQGNYPSTGFFMVMLALHICDQVSVFGFGPSQDGNWGHYFDKSYHINLNNGQHRGSSERSIILELAKKDKIQLYNGW